MSGFSVVLLVVQVIAAIIIICLVLLQQGKGADMGAAFGSGSAGSLFGSSGSANFLSRMTSAAVAVFFITTLSLTYVGYKSVSVLSEPDNTPSITVPGTPASSVLTTQTDTTSTPTQSANQIPTQ